MFAQSFKKRKIKIQDNLFNIFQFKSMLLYILIFLYSPFHPFYQFILTESDYFFFWITIILQLLLLTIARVKRSINNKFSNLKMSANIFAISQDELNGLYVSFGSVFLPVFFFFNNFKTIACELERSIVAKIQNRRVWSLVEKRGSGGDTRRINEFWMLRRRENETSVST